jgi:hypothetical protein
MITYILSFQKNLLPADVLCTLEKNTNVQSLSNINKNTIRNNNKNVPLFNDDKLILSCFKKTPASPTRGT